ncbi:MAG: FdhF/YdeP family oxidoreductase [Deltaproteobacteria bacterium]|nr:FdhF/YdeP family oxidoreductase [Deltaproteobacteria bacterium]
MRAARYGGGFASIIYTLETARRVGPVRLWRAMRSKNACKACALGMGGTAGGMRNELGHFPEVCKKSLQAMAADMQSALGEDFFARVSIEQMRGMTPRELEQAGRLSFPLLAAPGDTNYRRVSWNDALGRLAEKLRAADPGRSFFYASGRSSNEAAWLLQVFARQFGTNNVNNCSYYCHQASGAGLSGAFGSGTATVELADVEAADLFVLIGGNPASNHPRLMSVLAKLRRRGGRVIVVNPMREPGLVNFRVPSDWRSMLFGSPIANLYLQGHIGGDIAFMTGVAKRLIERGAVNEEFLRNAAEGWDDLKPLIERTTWDDIAAESGIGRPRIEEAADMIAASKSTVFGWTMGITHHAHGVQNVQWIANLALMRGMVGREGAGLLPIRGHSNVQGVGTVGVTPALKRAVAERLEQRGLRAPASKGLDTMGCMEAADRGEMDVAVCLGGNLFGSNPDAESARRALSKIGLVVYLNTSLNTGHAHGTGRETIILSVAARDEETQATTQESMFNYVRLSEGGPRRHAGTWSEVDIVADLAARVLGDGGPLPWSALRDHKTIRSWIAKTVPGLEALETIDGTGKEFTIPGRVYHTPRFSTPTGKARLHAHAIPKRNAADGQLRLMSVRSEGQFNTVVYEEEDVYRGQERRDVILLSARDMARLGLRRDQAVRVTSETGEITGFLARDFDIAPGNAVMYFPEANALISRLVDPVSRTPAFKSTLVTVAPV